jgi:ADP-ribose pyrophosphatase YjhB (NUDIX family)
MNHRISAGALVADGDNILLVRHRKPGAYDFWVAPGGGVEGDEDLHRALRREVKEECGLDVEPGRVAYIEDLIGPDVRYCKIWFVARVVGGELFSGSGAARKEFIVDARFLSRSQLDGRIVFPSVLRDVFWRDVVSGFPSPTYLGLRKMEFW